MMRLWLITPKEETYTSVWEPGYDKAHGFVVRAKTEDKARELANTRSGDEVSEYAGAWLDSNYSDCIELRSTGPEEVIIRDFYHA